MNTLLIQSKEPETPVFMRVFEIFQNSKKTRFCTFMIIKHLKKHNEKIWILIKYHYEKRQKIAENPRKYTVFHVHNLLIFANFR